MVVSYATTALTHYLNFEKFVKKILKTIGYAILFLIKALERMHQGGFYPANSYLHVCLYWYKIISIV